MSAPYRSILQMTKSIHLCRASVRGNDISTRASIRPDGCLRHPPMEQTSFVLADKSDAETNLPHDFIVKEEGVQIRYLKLTVFEVPYNQNPCISGLRVFGLGNGEKPSAPQYQAERTGTYGYAHHHRATDRRCRIQRPLGFCTGQAVSQLHDLYAGAKYWSAGRRRNGVCESRCV